MTLHVGPPGPDPARVDPGRAEVAECEAAGVAAVHGDRELRDEPLHLAVVDAEIVVPARNAPDAARLLAGGGRASGPAASAAAVADAAADHVARGLLRGRHRRDRQGSGHSETEQELPHVSSLRCLTERRLHEKTNVSAPTQ